jgi:RNA polymerase sigma-70 factor, ECF subfamily
MPDDPWLREAIRAHHAALRARARQLCRNHVDAEDLVQETYVRAMTAKKPLREKSKVRAWLLRILTNTFFDMLREQKRRRRIIVTIELPDVAAEEPTQPLSWEDISDEEVRAAIAQLSDDVRNTYRMFALECRSYADIATLLGIPPSTVGTRILRARRQLRALLIPVAEKKQ